MTVRTKTFRFGGKAFKLTMGATKRKKTTKRRTKRTKRSRKGTRRKTPRRNSKGRFTRR